MGSIFTIFGHLTELWVSFSGIFRNFWNYGPDFHSNYRIMTLKFTRIYGIMGTNFSRKMARLRQQIYRDTPPPPPETLTEGLTQKQHTFGECTFCVSYCAWTYESSVNSIHDKCQLSTIAVFKLQTFQYLQIKRYHGYESLKIYLKGLFHPAFFARVVFWLALVCHEFHCPSKWGQQRQSKRRHVQGMLDETAVSKTPINKAHTNKTKFTERTLDVKERLCVTSYLSSLFPVIKQLHIFTSETFITFKKRRLRIGTCTF